MIKKCDFFSLLLQAPNQSIQIMQTTPTVVTAAHNSSTMSAQSVQTLIRYVQAPPRMPMQPGIQPAQPGQIIRLPSGSQQLVTTVPATIRQMGGGQQQIVLSSQAIQNLKARKTTPNIYNV